MSEKWGGRHFSGVQGLPILACLPDPAYRWIPITLASLESQQVTERGKAGASEASRSLR
jgi:hypothetical protein